MSSDAEQLILDIDPHFWRRYPGLCKEVIAIVDRLVKENRRLRREVAMLEQDLNRRV